jgi:hypothetical protein
MKALFGVVGLLLVLGIVSVLAKKQLPAAQNQTVGQPTQQTPQQVKQQLETLMQQPRQTPEEK